MGFKPEQCVVVEDSLTGAKAAKSAEMDVLHFSSKPIEKNEKIYRAFNAIFQYYCRATEARPNKHMQTGQATRCVRGLIADANY